LNINGSRPKKSLANKEVFDYFLTTPNPTTTTQNSNMFNNIYIIVYYDKYPFWQRSVVAEPFTA
jgi:hypothetical protein